MLRTLHFSGFVLLLLFTHAFAWCQHNPALKFIENKNQWPEHVDFSARVPGGRLSLSPGEFSIYVLDEEKTKDGHNHQSFTHSADEATGKISADESEINGHFIQISFLGANKQLAPRANNKSKEYYNYFLGSDSSRWASRAYAYSEIVYSSLYAGIDLRISSVNENLKYDFIVRPEAIVEDIKIEYCGSDKLELNDGNIIIETSVGTLIEKKPYSFQLIDGVKKEIRSEYRLIENVATFYFPDGYDPCYELIIDPLLIFSTFSGSTADNWGSTATPGERGSLYSSGITNHLNSGGFFPATPGTFQTIYGGNYDVAILKYDSTGHTLLYASFLGGTSNETPHSLVMDSNEDLIVMGTTSSIDFPTSSSAFGKNFFGGTAVASNVLVQYPRGSDIFIARISSTGDVLKASTYLGGTDNDGINPRVSALTRNYGDEMRGDVITDVNGNIFISSVTASANFPVQNSFGTVYKGGISDAILVKLKPDLSAVEWGAFIGGAGQDASHTIKFDASGDIYIAGGSTSADFPTTTGVYQSSLAGDADGWISHIAKDGNSILHSTFTGTTGFDQVYFVDLNAGGDVYVYGQTNGQMPITPGVYNNRNSGQFVQKFSSQLNTLIFSTVFGSGIGIPNISPTAFLVNDCNNMYLTGWGGTTNSNRNYWQSNTIGMPVTSDALQKITLGSDFYFMVLTDDASQLLYATYLGGNRSAIHVDGGTSRFDKSGIVYHAVCAGCGGGFDDFRTTPGAWSRTNNSQNCNNAAFKFDLSSLRARIQTNSVAFNSPGLDRVCMPDLIRFQNFSSGGEYFEWNLGDGNVFVKPDTTSFVHRYMQEGLYLVTLKAFDQSTCSLVDVTQKQVYVFKNDGKVQEDDDLCFGTSYQLTASGGISYVWTVEDGTVIPPMVSPKDTTLYLVKITTADGCIKRDSVQLNVVPSIDLKFDYEFVADCFSRPSVVISNITDAQPDETYVFDFGDGFTSDGDEVTHAYEHDGIYTIKLSGVKEFCVYEKSINLPVFTLRVPNVITPGLSEGLNDKFSVQYGELHQAPSDVGINVSLLVINRWGKKVYESGDYRNDWSAEGIDSGIYYYQLTVGDYATCKSWVHVIK